MAAKRAHVSSSISHPSPCNGAQSSGIRNVVTGKRQDESVLETGLIQQQKSHT